MIHVSPEAAPLITAGNVPESFVGRITAAANTAELLELNGLLMQVTAEDRDVVSRLVKTYATDPEKVTKTATLARVSQMTPSALIMTKQILQEYAHEVVEDSVQLRNLVTNRLINETENPDPRIRIRALELLGKISDVGLFSEKTETTIIHKTTEDLRASLRQKLEAMRDITPVPDIEDAEEAEVVTLPSEPPAPETFAPTMLLAESEPEEAMPALEAIIDEEAEAWLYDDPDADDA